MDWTAIAEMVERSCSGCNLHGLGSALDIFVSTRSAKAVYVD
jgi:hypothetical protein